MKLNSHEQKQRIMWSIENWNRLNFLTATLRQDESDPKVISESWRYFVELLRKSYPRRVRFIRILQRHKGGHGWHIHAVCNQYIPAHVLLHFAELAGLGRMDFQMVSGKARQNICEYISRYITRDLRKRDPLAKGIRMITASGSLNCATRWWVRLSDCKVEQTISVLRKSLLICMEAAGMTLEKHVSFSQMIFGSSVEVISRWRNLNPGFVY